MTSAGADAERGNDAEEIRQRPRLVERREAAADEVADRAPRNHTPIMRPAMRAGASFVIALSPTGLSDSSANV